MMLLSWALAAPCDAPAAIASLRAYDDDARASYLCLATLDVADPLVQVIDALQIGLDDAGQLPAAEAAVQLPVAGAAVPLSAAEVAAQLSDAEAAVLSRFQRALALWLLQHADAPWDGQLVRRLNPGDRRLLADGVQARRGRETPAPEHAAVFAQFDWYRPVKGYTQNRLSDVDRANIATANQPPPPPPPPPAPPVEEVAAVSVSAEPECGCGRAWSVVAAAGLWGVGRRKRRAAGVSARG